MDGNSLIPAGSDQTLKALANKFTFDPSLFDLGVGLRVAL
jgi:hypothetical protein